MWEIFTFGAWATLVVLIVGIVFGIIYHRVQSKKMTIYQSLTGLSLKVKRKIPMSFMYQR